MKDDFFGFAYTGASRWFGTAVVTYPPTWGKHKATSVYRQHYRYRIWYNKQFIHKRSFSHNEAAD